MTTPNTIKLDNRFFMGGNATFTVDNGKGTHYTFRIRQPKKQRPGFTGPIPHFISLLTGPDNENSYTYMGKVEETPIREKVVQDGVEKFIDTGKSTLLVRRTANSKYTDDSIPLRVARVALHKAFTGQELPEGWTIYHMGKCGCCGRPLTVPESIERGIGPECWKRFGG